MKHDAPAATPDYLSIDEVARRLRLGRKAILTLVKRRELQHAVVGGKRKFVVAPAWLEAYVARCTVRPLVGEQE